MQNKLTGYLATNESTAILAIDSNDKQTLWFNGCVYRYYAKTQYTQKSYWQIQAVCDSYEFRLKNLDCQFIAVNYNLATYNVIHDQAFDLPRLIYKLIDHLWRLAKRYHDLNAIEFDLATNIYIAQIYDRLSILYARFSYSYNAAIDKPNEYLGCKPYTGNQ